MKLRFLGMEGISQADREDLELRVGELSERFKSSGKKFYIVGGVVRDLFLGETSSDVDITTDASPDESAAILENWGDTIWTQGAKFGTIGAQKNGAVVEVTTHRFEKYDADSRKPKVRFSGAVEQDLARRDFTINAMAIEMPAWDLVDPFNGRADLENKILRTPLSPDIAFSEDPLRMLRAARFLSGYSLTSEILLEESISKMAERIHIVSRERVNDEMSKLLTVSVPSPGIALLQRTKLGNYLFSSDVDFDDVSLKALDLVEPSLSQRWASIFWSLNKQGSQAQEVLNELRASKDLSSKVAQIINAGHVIAQTTTTEPSAIRHLLHTTSPNTLHGISLLEAHGVSANLNLREAIRGIQEAEGEGKFEIPLNGFEVTDLIGSKGPIVGEMLARLMDHRLEVGPISKDLAIALVLKWHRNPTQ